MKNRIKVLRAERDWSQQTLAQELGVSRQAVNAVERGKHDPSLQLAFDIANIFNLRIDDVFFPEKKLNTDSNEES
ncbi:helix-turn-helix transcriptional regulator [Rheinheimera baltica]|uniref:Helix-turn-helix transcriptional regulator n=2 Tax=Rheinheimera baltica TaxID=67576 RepID=A0ABT9I4J3_9GAMM|nr:helix-turn-helix transcriptional regulator [Rheinheimera baltica]MDP5138289.1 helix-turn-helix transcriptional regulator [Rheinheimera baltica]MDP5142869.1 helix-turn-helix transcriptional regulator [Rheinheimera baltica]MDP5149464.1 helix-turn-helix transcriptional regulator [Rheinheimera baltica]